MLQTKPYKLLYASFRLIFGFFIFYQLLISIHLFTVNGETPCKFCTSKQKKIEYDLAHQPTSVERNIIKQESEIFVSPEGSEERYRYSYRILWGLNIKSRGVVLYIQVNNQCVQVFSSYFIGLQLQINLTFVKLFFITGLQLNSKKTDSCSVLEKCRGGIARIKLVQGLAEKQVALIGTSVGSTYKKCLNIDSELYIFGWNILLHCPPIVLENAGRVTLNNFSVHYKEILFTMNILVNSVQTH